MRRLIAISVLILLAACSSPPSESATTTATAAPTTAAEFEPESVLARLRSEFRVTEVKEDLEPWGIQVGNTDTGYRAKRAAYQAFAEELAQRLPSVQVIA